MDNVLIMNKAEYIKQIRDNLIKRDLKDALIIFVIGFLPVHFVLGGLGYVILVNVCIYIASKTIREVRKDERKTRNKSGI